MNIIELFTRNSVLWFKTKVDKLSFKEPIYQLTLLRIKTRLGLHAHIIFKFENKSIIFEIKSLK